ncbi:MAG: FGGY-family carbohydrate kinase [Ectothiorhodospiraceae bacterium]|nr:FGGY-family carbohydrate kinase [Ectothiorhodospiraceae bacterium]
MTRQVLLGIDIGTTATKAVLLDAERGIVAEASAAAGLSSPRATWAEADAEQWWDNVGAVSRRCLREAGVEARAVAAVGVSGMVPTLALLDEGGRVLRPSIQQNDARAVDEIAEFEAATDAAEVLARTGSAVTQQSIGPKLRWLRRHVPQAMDAARAVVGSYDFAVQRLTGERSCERNWALESGLFDLRREAWDPQLLALAGIEPELLGPVRWPAEVAGEVTASAAAHTGLAVGTPVVAGSADHVASAFSAGLHAPGDLLVKLGGAGDVLASLDAAVVDPRLFLDYHVIPGKFLLNGCMAASGSLIEWFRRELAGGEALDRLDAQAAETPPGADGLVLLPYFLGEKTPINDPLARGALVGLTLSHTRGHVMRAVLEGIAYGFAHHLEVLAECGVRPPRARVTNGGARSTLWKQVTADVLGIPLEVVAGHPGSSLGAAFVAGKGVGVFAEWAEIERFVRIAHTVEPDRECQDRYRALYRVYRELYARNRDLLAALASGGDAGA